MSNLGPAADFDTDTHFDTGISAVYGSVTKDQRENHFPIRYSARRLPGPTLRGGFRTLPSPDNEYDVIPGDEFEEKFHANSVVNGASNASSRKWQEALNELYEPNQLMSQRDYIHPTISPLSESGQQIHVAVRC